MEETAAGEPASILIKVAANLLVGGMLSPELEGLQMAQQTAVGYGTTRTLGGLGLCGQDAPPWSSDRQSGQRGMDLARPVKASLYRRASGTDQLKSRRTSRPRRYWRSPVRFITVHPRHHAPCCCMCLAPLR